MSRFTNKSKSQNRNANQLAINKSHQLPDSNAGGTGCYMI